jgi:hypothetical protein
MHNFMKQVYTTKDAYRDNSVRVNYMEKDAVNKFDYCEFNPETQNSELKTGEEIYDNSLSSERLFWTTDEAELDVIIENTRQKWEERINS